MKIKTTRRQMIDRTIAQKGDEVTVTAKEGRDLVSKGHAVEVVEPEPKTKPKPTTKADDKEKAD